jgi:hypothetical protein
LFGKDCATDQWVYEYDEKDITPVGLRCRNLFNFPPNPEVKVAGGQFGANVGRGLHIFDLSSSTGGGSSSVSGGPGKRVKNAPLIIAKRMESRQLIEYQKLNDEIRSKLILGLK